MPGWRFDGNLVVGVVAAPPAERVPPELGDTAGIVGVDAQALDADRHATPVWPGPASGATPFLMIMNDRCRHDSTKRP